MSDQIEMWWKCNACHTLNGGLSKRCGERVIVNGKVDLHSQSGCGKSIDAEEWLVPNDFSSNAAITNSDHLKQALAGPDWICPYCNSSQRNLDGSCRNCAGNKKDSSHQRDERLTNRTVVSNNIPTSIRPSSKPISEKQFPIARSKFPEPQFEQPDLKKKVAIAIGVPLAIIAVIAIIIWALTPRYVTATVDSVHWKSTVNVERYQKVTHEGFVPEIDARNIFPAGTRIHHYDRVYVRDDIQTYTETYSCGQICTPIPRTCTTTPRSCTSNRNGTMSCSGGGTYCSGGGQSCVTKTCTRPATRRVPVYESQPRYQMYYTWTVWRWTFNRAVVREGFDMSPKVPTRLSVNLSDNERTNVSWTYTTLFKSSNEQFTYHPTNENEFVSLNVGTRKTLKITAIGVSIER